MKLSLGQVPTLSRICFVLLYRFYGETRQAGLFRGWFTSLEFEKSFEAVMMPWARDPVRLHKKKVVLLDGLASHYNIKVFQMAREVNMFLVFLPPNCTHLLQALVCINTVRIDYGTIYGHFEGRKTKNMLTSQPQTLER